MPEARIEKLVSENLAAVGLKVLMMLKELLTCTFTPFFRNEVIHQYRILFKVEIFVSAKWLRDVGFCRGWMTSCPLNCLGE